MIATTIIMVSAVFGNYIVPIMIGANDMAFPRLNALSFWTLFTAIPVLLSTIALGGFPTGWTGYAPLADQAAVGMDAYCFTIIVVAISIALGGDEHRHDRGHDARAGHDLGPAAGDRLEHLPLDAARPDRLPELHGRNRADAARPHRRHLLLPGLAGRQQLAL